MIDRGETRELDSEQSLSSLWMMVVLMIMVLIYSYFIFYAVYRSCNQINASRSWIKVLLKFSVGINQTTI